MKKVTNESELSVGAPSIRNKYKGAHGGKSKINYAIVKETTKKVSSSNSGPKGVSEEKIIIKKESQSSRIISGSPIESSSKITTKTVIQGGDTGSSRQKITITKTETSEKSKNSRALSGQKGKELAISERIETSSTSNNNPNGNQRGRIKQEITTKTTTTTTNQSRGGQSSGKQEIVKTVTNTTTESTNTQNRSRRGKEEITTKTTTTTTNQRSDSQSKGGSGQRIEKTVMQSQNQTQRQNTRGQSQGQKEQVVKEVTTSTSVNRRNEAGQKQVITTKKVITANTNQNKNELSTSKTSQINVSENKGRTGLRSSQQQQEQTTSTTTKQRTLIVQKSTPALRGNKETSNSTKKEKRAYSSNTEINSSRDNIIRITINDTGKIPKKTYVLNVRKLDRIQQNKRQRLTYSSKLEETTPITTNFNHNIIVIKNVTRELPTLSDIGEDGKLIHKFAYTSKTNIPNTVRKVIDESGKKPKKKPVVSPRKNEVIKTIKKPFKFTYENYTETNNSFNAGVKKIPLPTTSKSITKKNNSGELKSSRTNETKTSRVKMEGNEKTTTTTTTTTTETKSRIGRNKSEANMNKEEEKGSKITITKTEISTENKGGRNGKLQISRSGRNISENSGSTTEKKTTKVRESSKGGNKVETVTTEQVITQSGGKGRLGGGESSGSKITTVKKTEMTVSSQGDNSGRSRSRTKQETSSTTTTTTTKTVTKTSSSKEEAVQGGGVVKKFRAIKKVKK